MPDLSPTARAAVERTMRMLEKYPAAEVTEVPEDGNYDHRLVGDTLIGAVVCSRLTGEDAAAWLTEVRPPGTSFNRWILAEDTEPVVCEQFPGTHQHFTLDC